MDFTPLEGYVLVKIDANPYKNISTEAGEYDSRNRGLVIDCGDYAELEGKRIIWQAFKEKDALYTSDGDDYALIEYKFIYGVQDAQ